MTTQYSTKPQCIFALAAFSGLALASCSEPDPTSVQTDDVQIVPDLVVTSVTTPHSAMNGYPVDVTVRLCNVGQDYASSSNLLLVLAQNASPQTTDPWLSNVWVPSLAPTECITLTESVYPFTMVDGPYWVGAFADEPSQVVESDETNNLGVSPVIGIGNLPDLVVTAIDAPPSATSNFDAVVTVCNRGTQPMFGTDVALVLSTDTTIETPSSNPMTLDHLAGTGYTPLIFPGGCEGVSIAAVTGFETGALYLGAVVDEFNTIPELIEFNNTTVEGPMGIGYGPDFVIKSITAPAAAEYNFDVTVRVCNQGTDYGSNANLQLYVSPDDTIEGFIQNPMANDVPIGSATVYSLYAGGCANYTISASAPVPNDAWFIGAVVDDTDQVMELIETNNVFVGDRIGLGSGPDLVVRSIDAPPSANGPFDLRVEVCNQGTSYASSGDVSLYASTDETIESQTPYGGDFWLGDAFVFNLAPSECRIETVNAYANGQGAYYLGAIVDPWNSVVELNEYNNTFVGELIGMGAGVDIVVKKIVTPPNVDNDFPLSVTICNQGTVAASGFPVGVYLSSDNVIAGWPSGNDFLVATHYTSYLMAGGCEVVSMLGTTGGQTGAFYIGAVADPDAQYTELIESNNMFVGARIGAGYGGDLVIKSVSAPSSVDGNFDATVRVCNQGTAYVSGSNLLLVMTEDDVVDIFTGNPTGTFDPPIGNAPVPPISNGECADVVVNANAFALFPEQSLGAIVDEYGNVPELLEDNNTWVGAPIGIGLGPDVVVTKMELPPSADQQFTFPLTACNRGTDYAGGVEIGVYMSVDATFDMSTIWTPFGDIPIGSVFFPTLMPGECSTQMVMAAPFPLAQTVYVAGIVDPYQSQSELLESNNVYIHPNRLGVGSGPDLVVSALSHDPNTSGYFDVTATVCNAGTAGSSPTDVTIFGSAAPECTRGLMLTPAPIDALQPGQCQTQTFGVPFYEPGHIVAVVDVYESVVELDEDNNTLVGEFIAVGSGQDIVVTALDAPSNADGVFSLTWTACNQGTTAGTASFDVVASDNDILTQWDISVGQFVVTLAAGDCTSGSEMANAFGQGPYYLGAVMNLNATPQELRNDNDDFLGGIIGFGSGADYVVDMLTGPPSATGGFNVDYTVCNFGTAAGSGTELEIHAMQQDNVAERLAMSYPFPFAGWAPIPPLAVGACHSGSEPAFVPGSGAFDLIGVVNRFGNQPELRTDNNIFIGEQIGIGSGPDLVVSLVNSAPFASPGGTLDVTATICNQGTASSSPSDAWIYMSDDATITPQSVSPYVDIALTPLAIPALGVGQCDTQTIGTWVPSVEGTYYLGVNADDQGVVSELIEDNNVGFGGMVTLTPTFCGNGIVDTVVEECDDGNFADGDGCSAQCFTEHYVWQENANGTLRNGPYRWNYAMGYHFTANRNGVISALGGYFHGTKTMRLFDRDTGAVLAETQVTGQAGAGAFDYTDILAVPVVVGGRYTVAVYLAGNGGTYRSSPARFPQNYGDLTIDASTYRYTGSNPTVRPTNSIVYTMYGQADVRFAATE